MILSRFFPAFQNNDFAYRIFYCSICIAVICLPFDKIISTFPLQMAALSGIIAAWRNKTFKHILSYPIYIVFASMYVIFIYSFLISANRSAAGIDLLVKLSILMAPLLVGINIKFTKSQLHFILKLFVISCAVFVITSLSIASFYYLTAGDNQFFYKELVSFSTIHPAYIGMYISFAIVIVTLYILRGRLQLSRRVWLIAVIIVFLLFIILLTAKMALIFSLLFLSGAYIYNGVMKLKILYTCITYITALSCILFIIMSWQVTHDRFLMLFHYNEVSYDNSVNSREEIWQSSVHLLGDNWLAGVGSGDSENELINYFEADNFTKGITERYNAHSQYLQVFIEAGIFGFLFFMGIILYSLSFAFRKRNLLYLFFLLVFLINILVESMLETQSGVVFYALFNSILVSYQRHD